MKLNLLLGFIFSVCGLVQSQTQHRIINGTEAPVDAYPFAVSLGLVYGEPKNAAERQAKSEAHKIRTHFCTGSLIHDEWVLTAAHCIFNPSTGKAHYPQIMGVGLGHDSVDMYDRGRITAKKIVYPNTFNLSQFYHDIALVQLSVKVSESVFNDTKYSTACIGDAEDSEDPNDHAVTAIGWGNIERFSIDPNSDAWGPINYARYLQQLELKDESSINPKCQQRPDLVCVDTYDPDKSICRGDSGSPLLGRQGDDDIILGVASFASGYRVNNQDLYCWGDAKYQRASVHLDWIRDVIGRDEEICIRY